MPEGVVVTGVGIVSPLGSTARAHYTAACAGRSGIRRVVDFEVSDLRSQIAGQADDAQLTASLGSINTTLMDRFSQLAVSAATAALADAGLDRGFGGVAPERVAVCVGSGMGGRISDEVWMAHYFASGGKSGRAAAVPLIMPSGATAWVSILCGARGPSIPLSSACAAGSQSIGLGLSLIRSGKADLVIAGGADAPVTRTTLLAWAASRATSAFNDEPQTASRPFDRSRDGFVLSEGAGVVILERADRAVRRGASIYAQIRGAFDSADAFDIAAPSPQGEGAIRAMRGALDDAATRPEEITLVSAHATATRLNDPIEAKAIRAVFGETAGPLVMALKSLTGHAMGASGAIEAATLCLVLKEGAVPPNPNLHEVDPSCRLNHVEHTAGRHDGGAALVNSFAFGGTNSCLVLAPWR